MHITTDDKTNIQDGCQLYELKAQLRSKICCPIFIVFGTNVPYTYAKRSVCEDLSVSFQFQVVASYMKQMQRSLIITTLPFSKSCRCFIKRPNAERFNSRNLGLSQHTLAFGNAWDWAPFDKCLVLADYLDLACMRDLFSYTCI